MTQLDGMRERTVIVNSMSKTYSVTGWRVGYCIAALRSCRCHPQGARFSNRGRRSPVAAAGAYAPRCRRHITNAYRGSNARAATCCCRCWRPRALRPFRLDGAYYIMTGHFRLILPMMSSFTRHLIWRWRSLRPGFKLLQSSRAWLATVDSVIAKG